MIRVFEAFAGVGSQRMALRNLGIEHEVVAISEIDKPAIQSYTAIHGETYNIGDITKVDVADIPEHDLFTYSFPCTDISLAGKQQGLEKGSGTNSSLLWECQKVIIYHKPKYLMLENVKNLVGKKFKNDFDKWLTVLDDSGYNNYWKVLNAKDYGIPQNRERVFIISIRKDIDNKNFSFPPKQELTLRVKDFIDKDVDRKYYYSEERSQKLIQIIKEKGIGLEVIGELDCVGKIGINGHDYLKRVYNENGLCPTITTCQDGNTEPKIASCPLIFEERTDEGVRFFKDESIGTIRTINSGGDKRVYDGITVRRLTPKECWRLMGFDAEDFYKAETVCSNTQLYKQAGNSIVVQVLEGIFRNLFGG